MVCGLSGDPLCDGTPRDWLLRLWPTLNKKTWSQWPDRPDTLYRHLGVLWMNHWATTRGLPSLGPETARGWHVLATRSTNISNPTRAYHGTSLYAVESIIRTGLKF